MMASFNMMASALVAIASVGSAVPTSNQYFGLPAFPGSSSPGKAGLAYPKSSLCTKLFTDPHITWGYNWEGVNQGLPSSIHEFVPTCRGGKNAALCDVITPGSLEGVNYLFSFNEPDMPDQDSFGEPVGTYSKAVAMWHEKLEPHAGKVRLGAPAVSNSQVPGQGIDYLRGFLKSCTGCTIDFLCIHWHWYAPLTGQQYFEQFQQHVSSVHEEFPDKEIWVPEFSAEQGSVDEIAKFLKLAMAWMNKKKFITRFAYYMAAPGDPTTGAMGTPDGSGLNQLGQLYNAY